MHELFVVWQIKTNICAIRGNYQALRDKEKQFFTVSNKLTLLNNCHQGFIGGGGWVSFAPSLPLSLPLEAGRPLLRVATTVQETSNSNNIILLNFSVLLLISYLQLCTRGHIPILHSPFVHETM